MTKALTPLATELAEARTNAKFWKERAQFLAVQVKEQKLDAKLAKSKATADRRSAAIAKAQARLDKLLAKQAAPVGAKAIKANRKAGKATVTTYA